MMKFKSSLTCTIASLLMVFFFAAAVHGEHTWAEGHPKWGDAPPGGGPDTPLNDAKVSSSTSDYSQFGFLSTVLYDVSAVLVDYLYGNDTDEAKASQTANDASSRK